MKAAFKRGDVLVPKGRKYPVGALEVAEVDGEFLYAFPLGGGFRLKFDAAGQKKYAFKVVPKAQQRSRLVKAKFSIDDGPTFTGWWSGERWNGWATPAFEEEEFKKVLKWSDGIWDEEKKESVEIPDERDRVQGVFNKQVGAKLYEESGWCWDEVTAADQSE